ncbi:lysine exporter LysO family protein [Thermoproteus tenax]|uniref:Conserved membrane protein n=1 Tax=Thermoproteus tenax (strain ATCC 35583 / DSM 2078 / JCM 9277 / NBRC 100435 / Kra 1) TaxID=768679 RepID=G4RJE6_THETK|nr:lysine exporter LysO family protein [Thermoproteus tenax]CCC81691.1 conserved membrane protein [Thermoproteus tenax Kra 1]
MLQLVQYFAQYIGLMAAGYLVGRLLRVKVPSLVFTLVVSALIFLASAASADVIIGSVGYILAISSAYALLVSLASAAPLAPLVGRAHREGAPAPKISLVALASLILGISFGRLIDAPYESAIGPVLMLLLFLAGADISSIRGLKIEPRALAPPAASLAASFAVGLVIYDLTGVSPAVAVGMGWYSFTGPFLLTASNDPTLSTIGFLANFIREQLTYLLVPLLSSRLPREALIAMGGATTMDNTLPLYRSVYGAEAVVPAVINGVVLTIAVPVVVPLVYSLFPR